MKNRPPDRSVTGSAEFRFASKSSIATTSLARTATRPIAALLVAIAIAGCSGGGGTGGSLGAPPIAPSIVPTAAHANVASTTIDAYARAVLASGPAAYYRLDDTSSTAVDLSADRLDGAIGASVSRHAGLLGTSSDAAASFAGLRSASGVVLVPPNASLRPTGAVSIETILRFSTVPTTYTVPVAYGTDAHYAPYDLYFQSGHLYAQFYLSGGVLVVASPNALVTNTTYHVAATFDGSVGRLYLDGTQVASVAKSGTIAGYDTTHGLAIGDDAGYSDPAFAGTIDEVAIYSHALSASDVSAHVAAAGLGSAPAPAPSAQTTGAPAPTSSPATAPTVGPTVAPTATPVPAPTATSAPATGVATYAGCRMFPAGDWYNADVSSAAIDPNGATQISQTNAAARNQTFVFSIGIERINLATDATPTHTVVAPPGQSYYHASEFSGVPWPWQNGYAIEGVVQSGGGGGGDNHGLVLNTSTCELYETYWTSWNGSTLGAYSGGHWNLGQPFVGFAPSGMASGLSLFAGAIKWDDELANGSIDHALNFFVPQYSNGPGISAPAVSSGSNGPSGIPYGAHLRLHANFSESGTSQMIAVIRALKTYGMFLADTSSQSGQEGFYTINPADGNTSHFNFGGSSSFKLTDFDVIAPSVK